MTEEEYERKLEIVGNIMSKDEDGLTPDEEAELLQLVDEIEAYEDGMRDEWVIGGKEQIEALIADLYKALQYIELREERDSG